MAKSAKLTWHYISVRRLDGRLVHSVLSTEEDDAPRVYTSARDANHIADNREDRFPNLWHTVEMADDLQHIIDLWEKG